MSYFLNGLDITTEAQASFSDGITPLWLNANKRGLSSLEKNNGYARISAIRPIEVDKDYNWRIGYGLDAAVTVNHERKVAIQQAFAEVGYKKVSVSAGLKYEPIGFKDDEELTSGSMSLGNNAIPVPQVKLNIDWFSIPGTKHLWKWKAYCSYGRTTDGGWQERAAAEGQRRNSDVLYQEKALLWKFGNEESTTFPLTYELGLKMAAQFGGTSYNVLGRGYSTKTDIKHAEDLNAFMTILFAGGSDETDGSEKNAAGNHVGSWDMRLSWTQPNWKINARFERLFEDHSNMFVQYGIHDHLLGIDVDMPKNNILSALTVEHLNTRNQTGAIFHDTAPNIPITIAGRDNYYNNALYTGYMHWGQTLGNPLLTSPIYNNDGKLTFKNNRVRAWHVGIAGDPTSWLHWRVLASFSENWGTYDLPYDDMEKQNYFLVETTIYPYSWNGWQVKLGLGMDRGIVVGDNLGGQLTVSRTISFITD